MQTTHLALTFTPYDRLLDWLKVTGLPIALTVLGAVILARFVNWAGGRITQRIDDNYQQGDALVRSEATKHRHSVAQVITWVVITIIYVITAMKVLNLLGLPIGSLVAPATVLGAALGFGAQRVVQDILAGFFIITERQYGFGDTVQIAITGSGTDAEGVIEDVTLRVTRMHRVGVDAYEDKSLRPLLLDTPSVMGVESLAVDQVSVRMVARTLPGKQFQVGRALRVRVVTALRRAGITVAAELEADPVGGGDDE